MEAEPRYDVVWPLGPQTIDGAELALRPATLQGATIAFVWDWMYQGDRAFPIIQAAIERQFPDVRFVGYETFGDIHGPNEKEVLEALPGLLHEHGVDAMVAGVGHCGTCTPAVIRAVVAAERAGIPSVALVGRHYETMSNLTARFLGIEGLGHAFYEGNIDMDSLEEFDAKVAASTCDQVVERLLHAEPVLVTPGGEPKPRDIVFRGSFDEVNDHFYAQGWTDGLPVRPPTIERIEEFLDHTRRDPDDVLGVLYPEGREVTPWNVAVTGVMAGCRPEYMPVLVAVAEAISDPAFKSEDGGSGTGWEPLIILNGPVIEALDFNFGTGVMRVGRRANTSVGRFAKLLMINLAGQRIPPGTTDKTGVGTSFHVVLAEDEAAVRSIGWPTFGEERGIPAGRSGVTVQSVIGVSPPLFYGKRLRDDPLSYLEPVIDVFGKGMCGYWVFTGLKFANWHPTLVLSQEVAKMLADRGWTKDDLRQYVYENSTVRAGDLEARGKGMTLDIARQVKAGLIPDAYLESDDPDRLVSTIVRPDWLKIVVAGNPDGPVQQGYMNNHAQGIPITKLIDT